jgi:hypothetical protein
LTDVCTTLNDKNGHICRTDQAGDEENQSTGLVKISPTPVDEDINRGRCRARHLPLVAMTSNTIDGKE